MILTFPCSSQHLLCFHQWLTTSLPVCRMYNLPWMYKLVQKNTQTSFGPCQKHLECAITALVSFPIIRQDLFFPTVFSWCFLPEKPNILQEGCGVGRVA